MLIFKSKALILFFLKFRNFQGFQGPVGTQNIIQSVILNANRHVIKLFYFCVIIGNGLP